MQEVPISSRFLRFQPPPPGGVAFVNGLRYFASVCNGWCCLANLRRDIDATWRSVGAWCREAGWSKRRLLHELQNGLPYRTIPPGHTIDWYDDNVQRFLDLAASEVTIYDDKVAEKVMSVSSPGIAFLSLGEVTVGIEVLPPDAPTDAEVSVPSADASAEWAFNTTRHLLAKNRIPEDAKKWKAELARLLE